MNYEEIKASIFLTKEAAEYLNISKQRLSFLVQQNRIRILKKNGKTMIFYKEDLVQYKKKKEQYNKAKNELLKSIDS